MQMNGVPIVIGIHSARKDKSGDAAGKKKLINQNTKP
jgi:hypothetical protein